MSHTEIDPFWTYMEHHLKILDAALPPIICEANTTTTPIDEHLYDQSEYLFGAGFVAIQKYMLETCHLNKISVKKAVNLNVPDDESQAPFEAAVWAAANYWKHDAEWWSFAFSEIEEPKGAEKPNARNILRNLRILSTYGDFPHDYLCSNVLAAFTPQKELRLSLLRPLILDWREALLRQEEQRP